MCSVCTCVTLPTRVGFTGGQVYITTISGDPRHILAQISRITNPEDSRYGFLFICAFSLFVTFCKMWFLKSFFKNVFCGSVGNDPFTFSTRRGKIVYIGISPHPALAGTIWELLLLLLIFVVLCSKNQNKKLSYN